MCFNWGGGFCSVPLDREEGGGDQEWLPRDDQKAQFHHSGLWFNYGETPGAHPLPPSLPPPHPSLSAEGHLLHCGHFPEHL